MRHDERVQVLVVGAGPVGMFCSLLLANHGIRVAIIDEEDGPASHSYACALHPHTLQLFEKAAFGSAATLGMPIEKVRIHDLKSQRAVLDFSQLDLKFPSVQILPQSSLEGLLEARLKALEHVDFQWRTRFAGLKLDGPTPRVMLELLGKSAKGYSVPEWDWVVEKHSELEVDFVIGADGNNSQVRQCLGIPWEPAGPPESYEIFEFETELPVPQEMCVVIDGAMANVMWPIEARRCRWTFQVDPSKSLHEFPSKDRSLVEVQSPPGENDPQHRLELFLSRRAPWFKAGVKHVHWTTALEFWPRLATQFGAKHCWLAGDAAHQTGPVGMQSMNIGLCEAAQLASKIEKILRHNSPLSILDHYDRDRRSQWQRLLGVTQGLRPGIAADPWVREHRARIISCIPASGSDLTALALQLGLEFP